MPLKRTWDHDLLQRKRHGQQCELRHRVSIFESCLHLRRIRLILGPQQERIHHCCPPGKHSLEGQSPLMRLQEQATVSPYWEEHSGRGGVPVPVPEPQLLLSLGAAAMARKNMIERIIPSG